MSDRAQFLQQKARNFQAFLRGLGPDEYLTGVMASFSPENVESLLPIAVMSLQMRGVDAVVAEISDHIQQASQENLNKLRRYLSMFVDISKSSYQ